MARKYNEGSRYEVSLSMEWPPGQDIKKDIDANYKNYMTSIIDSESPISTSYSY